MLVKNSYYHVNHGNRITIIVTVLVKMDENGWLVILDRKESTEMPGIHMNTPLIGIETY